MAPATVSRRLALFVTSLGGRPTGKEGPLVDEVRRCLSDLPKKATAADQQRWLAWGNASLIDYMLESFGTNNVTALSDSEFGDRVFEVFKIVVMRTKRPTKFAWVLDDDLEWQEQIRVLVLVFLTSVQITHFENFNFQFL